MINLDRRLCVAPMIDVTDKHCRYFHRLLAPNALLYTEMITTGAILNGHTDRYLEFNQAEHPVAIQLGGSNPSNLAKSAKIAESWGYDEINLNCGCPSSRVQRGAFGACLMADPDLVADCCKAMLDASTKPITVKHRLGLDYNEDYSFLTDFVGKLHDIGINVFVVHARNAVLAGLSPKDNRNIPPLRYDVAKQLRNDFPNAEFIINGGIDDVQQSMDFLEDFDGVMLGRAAWHNPAILSAIHKRIWPDVAIASDTDIIHQIAQYADEQKIKGNPLRFITRAILDFPNGKKGARQWRRTLSDAAILAENNSQVIIDAWDQFMQRQ